MLIIRFYLRDKNWKPCIINKTIRCDICEQCRKRCLTLYTANAIMIGKRASVLDIKKIWSHRSGNQNVDVPISFFIHSVWTQLLWSWTRGLGYNDNRQLIRSHVRQSLLINMDFDTGFCYMMTSSNGNIFRVTGPLCGEFTGDRWIPRTKASDAELWCFLWSATE